MRNKERKKQKKAELEKQNQQQAQAKKEMHNKAQKKNNEEELDSPPKDGKYSCRFSAYFDFREMRKQISDFFRKMRNCEIWKYQS